MATNGTNNTEVAMDSMDASWNIFRYVGDYLHLGGILLLLVTIGKNKSLKGISRSTQVLYFLVFITRYLDLFEHSQTAYLVFFKLTYIGTSMIVLFLFYQLTATYERSKDTCNLAVIILPCATAAVLVTNEYSMLEVLWTFSMFVEGFAMVPQYIFCYHEKNSGRDWGANLYIISLGGYRVSYALNWIYKKIQIAHYSDIQSWIGGIIEIMLFFDFLNFRFTGNSMLRSIVLTVDTKISKISEKVEMKEAKVALAHSEGQREVAPEPQHQDQRTTIFSRPVLGKGQPPADAESKDEEAGDEGTAVLIGRTSASPCA